MKRRHYFILAIILMMGTLAGGCYNKKQVQDKPEGLINRNTMVEIIAESYIIESKVHTMPDTNVSKEELTKVYYKELFNRYKITREQFVNSVDYYIGEESSAEKLLNDVSELITERKKALNIPDTVAVMPSPFIN